MKTNSHFYDSPPASVETRADILLADLSNKFATKRASHLGYPYNLAYDPAPLAPFGEFLINNLGDPYVGSHYATEVCDLEREAVDWAMRIWQCEDCDAFWGAVGASGTEGNLWALYLGREALHEPLLVHSSEAHYSLPKAARILGMEALSCPADDTGAIDPATLGRLARSYRHRDVVLALTCGTTMKGAHDDIGACLAVLDEEGIPAERRFIHVDGALNAMVLPFLDDVAPGIRPSFRLHGIDSLSTSGHKMIGTPMPCGLLVARRAHVRRVASAISYLNSDDTTLMGSRNGHAVLAIWNRFMRHGEEGFRADARACTARAERFAAALADAGVPVLLNPCSLTVVFPQPGASIVDEYQLACDGQVAHAVVMPNVCEELLDRFLADYKAHWHRSISRKVHA